MGTELRHLMASAVEVARIHAGVAGYELAEHAGIPIERWDDLVEERADFTVVDLAGIARALAIPITGLLPCSTLDDP